MGSVAAALVAALGVLWAPGAAALVIDFEALPASTACVQNFTPITTQGFTFSNAQSANQMFVCNGSNSVLASNGTHTLLDDAPFSDVVVIEAGGALFDFTSFDVGEVFVLDPTQNATSLQAVGFLNDSIVAQAPVIPLDGSIDGPGGANDFQTVILPADFTRLDQVQLTGVTGGATGSKFMIDNLDVTIVPEPASGLLLALGLGSLVALRSR